MQKGGRGRVPGAVTSDATLNAATHAACATATTASFASASAAISVGSSRRAFACNLAIFAIFSKNLLTPLYGHGIPSAGVLARERQSLL